MEINLDKAGTLLDDRKLWQGFKNGNRNAYATIYHQHIRVLFSYGLKINGDRDVVKDCIQDLFFYLWEHRNGLGETDNVRNYLLTALRRQIIAQTKHTLLQEAVCDHYQLTPSVESDWINQQNSTHWQAQLQKALQTLPTRQQEAVFLKYYQNSSTQEIAEVMNINPRSVYKLLTKAIFNLKQSIPSTSPLKLTSFFWWLYLLIF